MRLEQFSKKADLLSKTEVEKVRLLAFFFLKSADLQQFQVTDVSKWFCVLSLPSPNRTRLGNNLRKSRKFARGDHQDAFRLHAREISALEKEFPELEQKSEEIISDDTILPETLYVKTRGYIESLAKQINASYEHNIFDGCAVLMRRLIEILLILSYENHGIESKIKDSSGNYKILDRIIADAKSDKTLSISRNTKSCLDDFRVLGNFSGHRIYYNCKRQDIRKLMLDYRAAVEEFLYKAGIRT
jgi:hypothetical protein